MSEPDPGTVPSSDSVLEPGLIDSTLRVAFFSDAFAERNGTGAYYHDLLEQIAPTLADVQMFQPGQTSARSPLSIPMPGDRAQRLAIPPLHSIARRLQANPPHVIVAVTPGPYGLLGAYHARRARIPLLGAFHTDFEQLARLYWSPARRAAVLAILSAANRIICRRARCMLINNAALVAQIDGLGARRAVVMGTPLQREFLQRPLLNIPPRLQHVCFAGRLAAEKNLEAVLSAARQLPEIRFSIAGDGPLRRELERQAADLPNVQFKGWLNRSALIELIDSASLLLLPSHFETFGSIALEAMARGRPALVSTRAGISRWPSLSPGLLPLDSPEALASTLRTAGAWAQQEWEQRSVAARNAAEQLNRDTLHEWLRLLRSYADG